MTLVRFGQVKIEFHTTTSSYGRRPGNAQVYGHSVGHFLNKLCYFDIVFLVVLLRTSFVTKINEFHGRKLVLRCVATRKGFVMATFPIQKSASAKID